MYTLEELQQKSLKELKEIGWKLNVLPADDRRFRQNWIDAIAGVNPPLLQLLETSPENVQAQESPIIETVEASPAADDVQAQEPPIESKFGRIVYPRPAHRAIVPVAENPPGVEVDRVQEPIVPVAETSPGVEVEQVQEPIVPVAETSPGVKFEQEIQALNGEIEYYRFGIKCVRVPEVPVAVSENIPGVEVEDFCVYCTSPEYSFLRDETYRCYRCEPEEAETSPGVEVDQTEDECPECVQCFDDGFFEDESGAIKLCQCSSEQRVSQSAIAPAAKNHIEEESDQNPILMGMALSDRFLARYSPPQPEIQFNVGPDGQLNLIDFKVGADEAPDPDDFESLDAFREAIARWDWEHPSSFDHCSDHFPSSVHSEPPDPGDFDSMFAFWAAYDAWDKASDDNSEPLEISLDSFREWAPCPEDWYEPHILLEPSKVMELSPARKSFITSDFFIPTFGRLGDRSDKSDEPPDTGIFALLPKPKPPSFPPQASQPKSAQARLSQSGIPKLSHRIAAGSNTQPARSPPGGDACLSLS